MPRLSIPGALVIALWGVPNAYALAPQQPDAAKLLRDLDRLSTVGRVLYVAAHPDDENTRLLAWLVANQKVRAAYLSLTRGEGGQNLIGAEQAPLLGLIRTQELLAARGIDSAEQMFANVRDFGYSKTSDETLRIWGKAEALGDVVWAIRKFEPDVIITRFSPEDHDTHGHHTASAMLALEAFHAAADPAAYPGQLKFVKVWQAKRIVWNRGGFGPQTPDSSLVPIDLGGYDSLLGTSAGEVAARSRSMHKSQGFGASPQRGTMTDSFKLLAGDPMQHSFLDGVDLTWARVPGSEKLQALLSQIRAQFDFAHPAASIPLLLSARDALDALPDNPYKLEKRAALDDAIAACAGLYIDATSSEPTATPGSQIKVTLTALNRSEANLSLHSVRIFPSGPQSNIVAAEKTSEAALANNQVTSLELSVPISKTAAISNPFWLEDPPTAGRWNVRDQTMVGMPEAPPPLHAEFHISIAGQAIALSRPVTYVWNDPVMGERRRPLEILPAATFELADPLLIFPDGKERELKVTVRATRGAVSGLVHPQAPAGFGIQPSKASFQLAAAGAEQELTFHLQPPAKLANESDSASGTLQLLGDLESGEDLDRSVRRIDYSHIPIQTLAPRAEVKLVRLNLKRAMTKIGYIPGAGDDVPLALRQVGYQVTMLSNEMLAKDPLSPFEAIVIGVRAFNTNERMPRYHQKLMDYVSAGGTLLVQYNTKNWVSKVPAQIGPWPFNISQDRVTDETAEVTLLEPNHPLFHAPNKIAPEDFSNWIQERGIYFADSWDKSYTPLLSMHDPNESAKTGSLLVGRLGKGQFIYTGLVFFRELPAGVPGAYRLFANLLSHGR